MAFSDESFGIELALEFIIFRLAYKGLYIQEMSDNVLFYIELNFILNLRLAYKIWNCEGFCCNNEIIKMMK